MSEGHKNNLKVLFLNRSYWPDVEATGQLLTELCSDLSKSMCVTVIVGRPNFVDSNKQNGWITKESHQGVQIIRVGNRRFTKKSMMGRVVGLLSYLGLAAWAALSVRRPDVIVVETDPPLLGLLGGILKYWHRSKLVFYLQDLYPEVGLALGKIKKGLLSNCLHWATQIGLRQADQIVVLGEDMRRRIVNRGIDPAKTVLIPNWVDTKSVRPIEHTNSLRQKWDLHDDFVIMYSGNIGLSQGLEQILLVAKELQSERVRFLFVGEGAEREKLIAKTKEDGLRNVHFHPYVLKEELSESLSTADLHLIPQRRGLSGCIVPSKLYGIMAAGRPYIAAMDLDSEVVQITQKHQTGIVIEPDQPEKFVECIRWCLRHPHELRQMGERGRQLAEQQYDRRITVKSFHDLLHRVAKQSR